MTKYCDQLSERYGFFSGITPFSLRAAAIKKRI